MLQEGMDCPSSETAMAEGAKAAVLQFYKDVRGALTASAITESSANAAAAAVEKLSDLHTCTVEHLHAHINWLEKQLSDATLVIEGFEKRLESSLSAGVTALQRSITADVEGHPREHTLKSDMPGAGCWQNAQDDASEEGTTFAQRQSLQDTESTSATGSRLVRQLEGDGVGPTNSAEAAQTRGTLLQRQLHQTLMTKQIKELTALLSKVVEENATYRQKIQLLCATAVPIDEYQKVVEGRDELIEQCETMRHGIQRLETEMEEMLNKVPSLAMEGHPAEALSDIGHLQCTDDIDYVPSHAGMAMPSSPSSPVSSGNAAVGPLHGQSFADSDGGGLQHVGLWGAAIQELEQQAVLAATQLSTADRLREAESHIVVLLKEREELRASLRQLEAEGKCVREDCQQLTFRNGVLSQQIASLLVQVERYSRAAHRAGRREGCEHYTTGVPDTEPCRESSGFPKEDQQHMRRGDVAAAVQSLLERRSAVVIRTATPSASIPCKGEHTLSHVLDVTLAPSGSLEVQSGLRTAAGVFAQAPSRSLQLRNLGSPSVTLEYAELPRLPASDKLSGVAFGRPSCFTTLDPSRTTNSLSNSNLARSGGTGVVSGNGAYESPVASDESVEAKRILDTLREDEDLGRFSVNSVSDLVRRNQELLKQLYNETQRASMAEERLNQELSSKGTLDSRSTSDTEAAQPQSRRSRKRGRDEEQEQVSTESEKLSEQCYSANGTTRHSSFSQTDSDRCTELEEHICAHIDAVVRKHDALLSCIDGGLAAALLKIMGLGRDSGSGPNNHQDNANNSAGNVIKDSIIVSLVRLCVQQGVRAADQAIALATAQGTCHSTIMSECWAAAQSMLRHSADELQVTLSNYSAINRMTGPAATGAQSLAVTQNEEMKKDGESVGEAELLQNITHLLRAASLREHTVQRVLSLAARRMRIVRCACPTAQGQGPCATPDSESVGTDDLLSDDVDDKFEDYSESTGEKLQRKLRLQLEVARANYERLLEEHHEERKQHTTLLDRMWRLEEEMVGARRERDDALHRMESMLTRDECEATVAALDAANDELAKMAVELQKERESRKGEQSELNHLRAREEDYERERVAEAKRVAEQLAQKDGLIAHYVWEQQGFQQRIASAEARARQLEMADEQQRSEMAAKEDQIEALRAQLRRAEHALLEQENTQELLLQIFPGDDALVKNSNLINELRSEKVHLSEMLADHKVQLAEAQRELSEQHLKARVAVQARQEAELSLQEAMLVPGGRVPQVPGDRTVLTDAASFEERLLELESLQRVNAVLLAEKEQWMEREKLLRAQLDLLASDPVSEAARRYGLQGTRTFEEQLEKMQKNCAHLQRQLEEAEQLRDTVEQLTAEKTELVAELSDARQSFEQQKNANETMLECAEKKIAALQQVAESYDSARLMLAEKEEFLSNLSATIAMLEAEKEEVQRLMQKKDEEREQLLQDNLKLIESVSALSEEVKKKEAERKAAQAALAQGLVHTPVSSRRWRGRTASAGGSGSGGGSTGPVTITRLLGHAPP
ncbi:hypothetical protein TRVL_06813 [Trypanosoma vivax]|uniref:Uncharacterized protein n=1 Tax=Trypanosoma vivax (strain Y486) TaxID=1055687 RepID=G0U2C0_TRYVY|nr:hypothetical protein TRVL_06813 [Trypanosoma vivax]CCC50423.1 conserved hypothetical protein [Trypanosoma vivax Y486]